MAEETERAWVLKTINQSGWTVGRFLQFVDAHGKIDDLEQTLRAYAAWAGAGPSAGTPESQQKAFDADQRKGVAGADTPTPNTPEQLGERRREFSAKEIWERLVWTFHELKGFNSLEFWVPIAAILARYEGVVMPNALRSSSSITKADCDRICAEQLNPVDSVLPATPTKEDE